MNRFAICKVKCLDTVTLKVLPISCFHYNSEGKKFKSEANKNDRIYISQFIYFYSK